MVAARDYQSLRDAMIAWIKADPTRQQKWTDLTEAGIGMILLEMAAFMGDLISFANDRRAEEAYLERAVLPESVRRIARSWGYPLSTRSSASVVVTVDAQSAPVVDVTLPEFAFTAAGRSWWYPGGYVWPAGATEAELTVTEGIRLASAGQGTGENWQLLTVPSTRAVRSSVEVTVNGVLWSAVEVIGAAGEDATEYEVRVLDSGELAIQFGNGSVGAVPALGAAIQIRWLDSTGAEGAVGTNALEGTFLSFWATELGGTMVLTVRTSEAAIGAHDAPAVVQTKPVMQTWLRSIGVGVTAEDIESLAMAYSHPTYGRIANAKAIVGSANLITNAIRLVVAARSGDALAPVPTALKEALNEWLQSSKMLTVEYEISNPTFVYVDIVCKAKAVQGVQDLDWVNEVKAVFTEAFNPDNLGLCQPVNLCDLYEALGELTKVQWVVITSHNDNIEPNPKLNETLVLRSIEVITV